ncbi:MAG: uroporphyrinogen decarboxylase family protein [Kiritimatiellales bacterium]
MNRSFYLDLAANGLRMPIATHLILHENPDVDQVLLDGSALGEAVIETANRYHSPLAVPLMDLALEKDALLALMDIPEADREKFHLSEVGDASFAEKVSTAPFMTPRMKATCDAVQYVAEHESAGGFISTGMGIGPFSLLTKLLSDPITPVFMAGTGLTGEDDDDVALLDHALDLSVRIIVRYLAEQAKAGAKAIIVCEPAANLVYFSPKQLEEGSDVFERFVLEPNLKIKAVLDELDVDLIFHDCGELTDEMVSSFNRLDPAVLSLGCSRVLWHDASLVSKQTVLYGNLPSKRFYSDESVSVQDVEQMTKELILKMREVGHPFIMGTECDVLSVPGKETTIKSKIAAMMSCNCG